MTAANRPKILLLALGVVGLFAIGLLISTIVLGVNLKKKSNELKDRNDDNICTTEECAKAAGDMLKAMDRSVSPCDNFYQFSCGNWVKNNPIPDTYSSWNQFNVLRDQLSRNIRGILETEVTDKDPDPVKMAKGFYATCMGQNSVDQTDLHELVETVLKIQETGNNVGVKLGELRRRVGDRFIANAYVELDQANASQYIIYIDQPGLGINRAFLISPDHPNRQAYRNLIVQVWPLVYPSEDHSQLPQLADDLVEFETRIAQISAPPDDRRDRTKLYNLMTLAEFAELTSNAPMINWEEYITEVFKDVAISHGIELGPLPQLHVVIRDVGYFEQFGQVLQETDVDLLANYLKWRVIFGLGDDVSPKMREVLFEFTKKTQGTLYPSPRWQVCSDKANFFFGMAISYHYVQDVFSGDFETQMGEMIENIQTSFSEIIDNTEWISTEETRQKAKVKAQKMKEFVGFPDWLLTNSSALDIYYDGLNFNLSEHHFHNLLQVAKWRNMESLRRIVDTKDTNRWTTDPTVVNAFYSSTYNSISFPAGILQPPFYFTGRPIQALNYGGVGMVIGHEITHGFDDSGRQSDGDGNLVNWWDKETEDQYKERALCFINQYSKYQAEEANNITLNGNTTLGENIADNGGLRESFNAYKAYVNKHGAEPYLPGVEYSPEQLFFVAFAQIWCGSYTPQGMETQVQTGVHSPNRFRVRGVLENSVEFANTWNCPQPPATACKIW